MTNRMLTKYLRDHRAGAAAGISLSRHCARANAGSELGRSMETVAREIEQDRASLDAIMRRVGVRPNPVALAAAWVAAQLGRLKINDRLVRYSALSRLLELEGLVAAIQTKQSLWQSLEATVAAGATNIDPVELERLLARGAAQRDTVLRHHRLAAAEIYTSRNSRSAALN